MGLFDNLFGKKPDARLSIPTVKFDSKLVSPAVVAQVKDDIRDIVDIPPEYADRVQDAALTSIAKGRHLASLKSAIMGLGIDNMTSLRANEITSYLHNRATSRMSVERSLDLGITTAIWIYSGAPCEASDTAHRAANGTVYKLKEGLWIGGKWTWPGMEPGCRCIDRPAIKGFS